MNGYWENRFKNEGAMWKFEPAESTLMALDLFKANGIHKLLIPGFGYGRNAKVFIENGFTVTGIEISRSAIDMAKENGLNCTVHHGSVKSVSHEFSDFGLIKCSDIEEPIKYMSGFEAMKLKIVVCQKAQFKT